jgi:misacylated tRNA(Ala) deacylase
MSHERGTPKKQVTPMTERPLYMEDSYLREWDAVVVRAGRKENEKGGLMQSEMAVRPSSSQFIVLDRTAFYPKSGGQSWDEGTITRVSDGKTFRVVYVGRFGGSISHEVEAPAGEELKPGDSVKCRLDWERRHMLMRAHTAAHIISEVIYRETGAKISGNQLEPDKCRIDFSVPEFDREKLKGYEQMSNDIVARAAEIRTEFKPRDAIANDPSMTKLAKGIEALPEDVKELRVLYIGDFEPQADGGTHVKNTGEVGKIVFTDFTNKGKNNRRIYFRLE